MNFKVLEKIILSPGEALEKSWKSFSEKGWKPCLELDSSECHNIKTKFITLTYIVHVHVQQKDTIQ